MCISSSAVTTYSLPHHGRWCFNRTCQHCLWLGVYIDSDLGAAIHLRRTVAKQPRRTVSPHCDSFISFIIYVATLPTSSFALSWYRSSTLGSITAPLCLSDFLPISNDVYRPYSTPQLAWYFDFVTMTCIWRPLDTALAASARTCQLLTGAHGIPSVERCGATISESARSGVKPARSSPSAVVIHTAAAHPRVPSVNSRPSFVSCCSLHFLEHCQTTCSLHRLPLPSDNS